MSTLFQDLGRALAPAESLENELTLAEELNALQNELDEYNSAPRFAIVEPLDGNPFDMSSALAVEWAIAFRPSN